MKHATIHTYKTLEILYCELNGITNWTRNIVWFIQSIIYLTTQAYKCTIAWSNTILTIASMQNWKILEHYGLRAFGVGSKQEDGSCVSPFIRLLELCVSLFRHWLKNVWCLPHRTYLSAKCYHSVFAKLNNFK